jgi:hypothetical protein
MSLFQPIAGWLYRKARAFWQVKRSLQPLQDLKDVQDSGVALPGADA